MNVRLDVAMEDHATKSAYVLIKSIGGRQTNSTWLFLGQTSANALRISVNMA